jgi:hypothetical protein
MASRQHTHDRVRHTVVCDRPVTERLAAPERGPQRRADQRYRRRIRREVRRREQASAYRLRPEHAEQIG